jgi:hypothetical protein
MRTVFAIALMLVCSSFAQAGSRKCSQCGNQPVKSCVVVKSSGCNHQPSSPCEKPRFSIFSQKTCSQPNISINSSKVVQQTNLVSTKVNNFAIASGCANGQCPRR